MHPFLKKPETRKRVYHSTSLLFLFLSLSQSHSVSFWRRIVFVKDLSECDSWWLPGSERALINIKAKHLSQSEGLALFSCLLSLTVPVLSPPRRLIAGLEWKRLPPLHTTQMSKSQRHIQSAMHIYFFFILWYWFIKTYICDVLLCAALTFLPIMLWCWNWLHSGFALVYYLLL